MFIPEDIVNRLAELPIEEVAEKLGITVKSHKAHCFMHDDHNPSLSFNVKNNMFFCFVCNKGGGPIQLVQEREGLNFQDACNWLGSQFDIWWPEDKHYKKTVKRAKKKIYLPKNEEKTCVFDEGVFAWLINNAGLSELANIFLFEKRRFKKDVIQKLNIKSVSDSQKVLKALLNYFGEERCLAAGIIKRGNSGLYFYFYTPCLLFPYYEKDGRLVGLQSRYLGIKENAPRFQFLSSRKTRLFNLPVLNTIKNGDKLFVSEGVTDCLAMLSNGLNAVAIPSATILPLEDLITLANFDLHMYPDQDEVGQKAFMELRRFFVNNYSTIKAEKLPEGVKDYSDYYIKTYGSNG